VKQFRSALNLLTGVVCPSSFNESEVLADICQRSREKVDAGTQIVFRVVCMDNPQCPMYSQSIYTAYDIIRLCVFANERFADGRRSIENVYGLNAHQFFGIGLPFVRRAIELVPESAAAMIQLTSDSSSSSGSSELYQCIYRLPSEQDANKVLETLRTKSSASGVVGRVGSPSGCARAEQLQPLHSQDQDAPRKALTYYQ
jgi:hypothetical protein